MLDRDEAQIFEDARPNLLGLAYRILGSLSEAEDAVQDTFLRWAETDRTRIEKVTAWLTTTCTRRCIDLLRSARRARVNYVGAWLPEPIHTPLESNMDDRWELPHSLTTAFLLLLERLTPKERAAYLLREIFEIPYPEIAEALDMQENSCRKLVSRARANIGHTKVRHTMPPEKQNQLLEAFQTAVKEGSTARLATLLSHDIKLSADGGGKVSTIPNVLYGRDHVLAFVGKGLKKYWAGHEWKLIDINSSRGIVLEDNGALVATVTFAYDDFGRATDIFIMRNPDKLTHLGDIAIS